MSDPVLWHRLQFAFTIVYHYLFPQLTMGLALLIVVLKSAGLRTGDMRWNDAARFWIRIFGINFAVGRRHRHPDGVPVRHQLGGVLEVRRRRDRPDARDGRAVRVLPRVELPRPAGLRRAPARPPRALPRRARARSPAAGCPATSSSAPTPSCSIRWATRSAPTGALQLADFWAFLLNPWALAQYAHNMSAAVVTGSFVMAAVGAYYALQGGTRSGAALPARRRRRRPRRERAGGVPDGRPPGEARRALPAGGLAAMEGRFESGPMAGIVLIGQPNVAARRLDNPILVPGMLSFLAFGTFLGEVRGSMSSPRTVARQHRAALLRLPRHGGPRHAVHRW